MCREEKNTHDRANLVGQPAKQHLNIVQFVVKLYNENALNHFYRNFRQNSCEENTVKFIVFLFGMKSSTFLSTIYESVKMMLTFINT